MINSRLVILGVTLLVSCNSYYINPLQRPVKYHRFGIDLAMSQDTILFGKHEWIAYQRKRLPDEGTSNWVIFRDGRLFKIIYLSDETNFAIKDTSLSEGLFGVWQKDMNGSFKAQIPQFGLIYEFQGTIDSNQISLVKRIVKPLLISESDSISLIFNRSGTGE